MWSKGGKKDKMTNNNLHNTTQKTKDRTTRTPLKTGGVNITKEKENQYGTPLQSPPTSIDAEAVLDKYQQQCYRFWTMTLICKFIHI
jgi:hypothetical protein